MQFMMTFEVNAIRTAKTIVSLFVRPCVQIGLSLSRDSSVVNIPPHVEIIANTS
jgi:hypothetical protein